MPALQPSRKPAHFLQEQDGRSAVHFIRLPEKPEPEEGITLRNVIKCRNSRCITTTEQELDHVFKLVNREHDLYRCIYCETKEKYHG